MNFWWQLFVGVLGTGVPRSTCWKAQLRPIYINTTRSSSTRLSTQRAQDPRGGVSREEEQDPLGEGFVEDLGEDHHHFRTMFKPSSPRKLYRAGGRRGSLPSKQPATSQGAPRVKEPTVATLSAPVHAPRVVPTPPLWGYDRLLVLQ